MGETANLPADADRSTEALALVQQANAAVDAASAMLASTAYAKFNARL